MDRDRLLAIFQEELEERRRELEQGLLELDSRPAQAHVADIVRGLFRAAHSLKGAAASVGLPAIESIAAQLEDVFSRLRDDGDRPSSSEVTRLLEQLDRLVSSPSPVPSAADAAPASTTAARPAPPTDRRSVDRGAGSQRARVGTSDLDASIAAASEMRMAVERLGELPPRSAAAVSTADRLGRTWRELRTELSRARSDDEPRLRAVVDRCESELERVLETVHAIDRLARESEGQLTRAAADVQRAVGRMGLVPFADVCAGLDRIVRDVASRSSKEAALAVAGEELELDRAVASALRDPLVHLVRNAVDHGIETPDRRRASGKPTTGSVRVEAEVRQGKLVVAVADDGSGVDRGAVVAAAQASGLDAPEDAAAVLPLVFTAGLSTAGRVSDVSGRGVGLDAVRTGIEAVGGSVSIESVAGAGTRVEMMLPMTLSVLPVLIVEVAGERVALPATAVERVVRVAADDVVTIEGVESIPIGDRVVRVVDLAWLLGFSGSASMPERDGKFEAVIVRTDAGDTALAVGACLAERDVMLKTLGRRLEHIPGALGGTVLGDGHVAMVLNPVTWGRRALEVGPSAVDRRDSRTARRPRVLLAEDTLTTRTLERSILEAAGYDVIVAVDGADAWRLLERHGADLVVSDVDMPNIDGFVLCETIRSSPRFADVPVVLVTSLADERSRTRGMQVGANAYVVKSAFDQGTLLETIDRLL